MNHSTTHIIAAAIDRAQEHIDNGAIRKGARIRTKAGLVATVIKIERYTYSTHYTVRYEDGYRARLTRSAFEVTT